MNLYNRIRHFFAGMKHADMFILTASCGLLLLFFITEITTRQRTPKDFYSPQFRCLLLVLICTIFYLGGWLYARRTGAFRIIRRLMVVYFILYLYLLFSMTLFDTGLRLNSDRLVENGITKRQYYMQNFVNIQPFHSIYTVYIRGLIRGYVSIRYTLLNLLGNLCAFMPLAFFLPCFWKKMRRWYLFIPTVFLIVALVEGAQFCLMVGSCDIDDLILNAGGSVLLFFLLRIPPIHRFCKKIASGQLKIAEN